MAQSDVAHRTSEHEIIDALIARARAAMSEFGASNQARVDDAVIALAWSLYHPDRALELAKQAVRETGLGNVDDKVTKNQRKTFGTLRDLLRVRTVGIIENDPSSGLIKFAKPVGVVAAITPSTNPSATPVNKAMMAIKGRNAIIMAPSPAAWPTTATTVECMRSELARIGMPADLVQVLPQPVTRTLTQLLMENADLVVATGSQNNVRSAYRSGTPAIGVGAGNVPVIIDSTADLDDAAAKVCASKTFDNATSCSSENSLVILDDVYESAMSALAAAGGYRASPAEKQKIETTLWVNGKLNRKLIAKDAQVFASEVGLSAAAQSARFFLVEDDRIGKEQPLSDEKLSLVLTVYRAENFDQACDMVRRILEVQGRGHSCGIHTRDFTNARRLAAETDVVRVLVNQAHTFGNGGSFDNGLNFTLSMGCGTWGRNSISENLSYHHFLNITHLCTTIPEDKPTEEELFGQYFAKYGKE